MTEVRELPPELAAMLMQQQGGRPNPEFEAAQDAFHDAVRRFEREAFAQVQFFGAILCNCETSYEWGKPFPPQQHCVVHGHVMTDRETGAVLLLGIPEHW
jgi:hypothetical protein